MHAPFSCSGDQALPTDSPPPHYVPYTPPRVCLCSVRLPKNGETGHGVVLGEGKPENQNAAVIFCFGEVVQVRLVDRGWQLWAGLVWDGAGHGAWYAARSLWTSTFVVVSQARGRSLSDPASPVCTGQAIDMNQDNYLAEALKMRNLVSEFNPPVYNDLTAAAGGQGGGTESRLGVKV